MYPVKDKNKTIYFLNKVDADNYIDYLQSGLKVIKKSGKTYHFNNGDSLINVTFDNESPKKYVLVTRCNRRIISEKLQKKHITAIKNSWED